jgi:hypothetical protein
MRIRAHLHLAGAGSADEHPAGAIGVLTDLDGDHRRVDVGPALDVDGALELGPPGQLLEHLDEMGMKAQLGHGPHLRQGVSHSFGP